MAAGAAAAAAAGWEVASREYMSVLGVLKEGWVEGWREWSEVLLRWKGAAVARKVLRFVLGEMGSVLLPVGKVGGEGGRKGGRNDWTKSSFTHIMAPHYRTRRSSWAEKGREGGREGGMSG